MLKLLDNPPVSPLAPEGGSVFDGACLAPWAALYTRPRQEKALASDLLKLGVSYFLPLVLKTTISGNRRRRTLHPLFPSYVFASASEAEALLALRTDRVVQRIVPAPTEQPRFVSELRAIERAVLTCPERIELQPRVIDGAWVRIISGSMKGTEGVVVKSDNRVRVCLQVKALGTGVLVEIETDLLEPLS